MSGPFLPYQAGRIPRAAEVVYSRLFESILKTYAPSRGIAGARSVFYATVRGITPHPPLVTIDGVPFPKKEADEAVARGDLVGPRSVARAANPAKWWIVQEVDGWGVISLFVTHDDGKTPLPKGWIVGPFPTQETAQTAAWPGRPKVAKIPLLPKRGGPKGEIVHAKANPHSGPTLREIQSLLDMSHRGGMGMAQAVHHVEQAYGIQGIVLDRAGQVVGFGGSPNYPASRNPLTKQEAAREIKEIRKAGSYARQAFLEGDRAAVQGMQGRAAGIASTILRAGPKAAHEAAYQAATRTWESPPRGSGFAKAKRNPLDSHDPATCRCFHHKRLRGERS